MVNKLFFIENKIVICDKDYKIIYENVGDENYINKIIERVKKGDDNNLNTNITINTINYNENIYYLIETKIKKGELFNNIFIDYFTGLFNRNFWEYLIKNKYRCDNLCIIDINNLKEINDKYGHLEGDQVIKALAKKLQAIFKMNNEIVIRYGGDEYIVLTNKKENEVKRLLLEVKNELINNLDYKVNFSFGISKVYKNLNKAFNKADKILYRNKKRKVNKKAYSKDKVLEEIEKLRDRLNLIMQTNYLENYSEVLKLSNELDVLINKYIGK